MESLSRHLAAHKFGTLFREELGWDYASSELPVDHDGRQFCFKTVAHKRGFQVLHCLTDRRTLFNRALLRGIQRRVARSIHEHILIYACDEPPKQVWQWAIRTDDGRSLRHREHPFFSSAPPSQLISRLGQLKFSLDEEERITLVDALDRVRLALDVSPEQNLFVKHPKYARRSDELAIAMVGGDEQAFHRFIEFHRPLAKHLSKRLQRWFGMDADDAEQIGVIGLIQAAKRFDPSRGYQFSTYATFWVRQACQRLGPDAALMIRLPMHIFWRCFPIARRLERKIAELGMQQARAELLGRICEDRRFRREWRGFELAMGVRSLSDRREPEFREARSIVASNANAVDFHCALERAEIIRSAISRLHVRDGQFVKMRHGIDGPAQTLEEIGNAVGLTRERVRQIAARGERRLRELLSRIPDFRELAEAFQETKELEETSDG